MALFTKTYSIFSLNILIFCVMSHAVAKVYLNGTVDSFVECNTALDNAELHIFGQSARVVCSEGYDLDGPQDIDCVKGQWNMNPRCIPRCSPPPKLLNGTLIINENEDPNGNYRRNTLATYSCHKGFTLAPPESKFRVCEEGIWTGPKATCLKVTTSFNNVEISCERPSETANGYFVYEKLEPNPFSVGQRLHYSCKEGYILEGSSVQQCLENGQWSPKIQPICWKPDIDHSPDVPCGESPFVPHSSSYVVQGKKTEDSALPGTVIEIKCLPVFQNFERVDPCQPTRLTCSGGRWVGIPPICVPSLECPHPPIVDHATASIISGYKTSSGFPIKSQVSYKCLPEYFLEGSEVLTCTDGGCWFPSEPPTCVRLGTNYYLEVNNFNAFLVSLATGAGVLSILLVICLLVIFKRKRQLGNALSIPPPVQRPDMGDHAILLHQPDRLALIAFADGMQAGQRNVLPSYDEAIRDRGHAFSSVRQQRPHWQHISSRRNRNSPNPDMVHIGRHGSFVSHTSSTRSAAGDSMGSTDTMAVSENSTNVTLDTASSLSGSQATSCRANCGSLASFDTGSIIITDDVPLLEESELEEIQVCDTISLVLENPSSDNASHKLSTTSADLS